LNFLLISVKKKKIWKQKTIFFNFLIFFLFCINWINKRIFKSLLEDYFKNIHFLKIQNIQNLQNSYKSNMFFRHLRAILALPFMVTIVLPFILSYKFSIGSIFLLPDSIFIQFFSPLFLYWNESLVSLWRKRHFGSLWSPYKICGQWTL